MTTAISKLTSAFATGSTTVPRFFFPHQRRNTCSFKSASTSAPSAFASFLKSPLVGSARLVLLQAGSSISLLLFLLLIKARLSDTISIFSFYFISLSQVVMFHLLSQSSLHPSSPPSSRILVARQERELQAEFLLRGREGEEEGRTASRASKAELESSLRALQRSPECAGLLRCLSYSLEVNARSLEDREGCRKSYVRCGEQGLLGHLNRLLEALDERKA